MGDPFSVAAGVVGIVVPALQVTKLLLEDLQKISEAPATVETLRQDVVFIEETLESLATVSTPQWAALGATVVEKSGNAITSCTKSCADFRTDLQRWTRHSHEGDISWRDRASLGLFRQGQIKAMSEQLQKNRTALTLVVSTATLHSSIRGQRTTEELKTAIAAREKDIAESMTNTSQQLSMLNTRFKQPNPTDIVSGNTSGTGDTYEDEAGMRRTIEEERAMLHVLLELLEGLKKKTQDEAKKMAEEEQKRSIQVTFGNDNSGFQLGHNSGPISGFSFGGRGSQ